MGILFQVTDPDGLEVVCEEEWWKGHVISQRPFMDNERWVERVKNAIASPNRKLKDPNRDRYIYYKKRVLQLYYAKAIVCLKAGRWELLTAYPEKKIKEPK